MSSITSRTNDDFVTAYMAAAVTRMEHLSAIPRAVASFGAGTVGMNYLVEIADTQPAYRTDLFDVPDFIAGVVGGSAAWQLEELLHRWNRYRVLRRYRSALPPN